MFSNHAVCIHPEGIEVYCFGLSTLKSCRNDNLPLEDDCVCNWYHFLSYVIHKVFFLSAILCRNHPCSSWQEKVPQFLSDSAIRQRCQSSCGEVPQSLQLDPCWNSHPGCAEVFWGKPCHLKCEAYIFKCWLWTVQPWCMRAIVAAGPLKPGQGCSVWSRGNYPTGTIN